MANLPGAASGLKVKAATHAATASDPTTTQPPSHPTVSRSGAPRTLPRKPLAVSPAPARKAETGRSTSSAAATTQRLFRRAGFHHSPTDPAAARIPSGTAAMPIPSAARSLAFTVSPRDPTGLPSGKKSTAP
ncbi:MAG: hypothetical protein F4Z83_15600 [Gemmatimonadetes bacterium]|nr:hypothetical protein [Gemmatimonadota bacterium]